MCIFITFFSTIFDNFSIKLLYAITRIYILKLYLHYMLNFFDSKRNNHLLLWAGCSNVSLALLTNFL